MFFLIANPLSFLFVIVASVATGRSHWIDVTIGFLKNMAADWYERNHLQYQAGGVTIDDRNKWQSYRKDGQFRLQQYKDWLKDVKVQLNMQGGWGRSGYFRLQ